MKNFELEGKTVVITGASQGIGEAAARCFAAAGADVALLARSNDKIQAIANEIGPKARAIACDVSDYEDVVRAVAETQDAFDNIDIFIGNAGVIDPIGKLADTDVAEWSKLIDINLKGVHHGMHAVIPSMVEQGHGTIITVSSGAAHGPVEGWSAYCSSKAGAYMLTRVADHEYREQGIRVLGLSPGTVATNMQKEIKASGINPVSKLDWSDHIAPDWPARTLMWMCTSDADEYLGNDVMLRDESVRKSAGLI